MILINSEYWHYETLRVQASQRNEVCNLPELKRMSVQAVSLMHGSRVLVVSGVIELSAHRGGVWAVVSEDARQYSTVCVRTMRRWLDSLPYTRLEAAVRCDFPAGHRLIKDFLGFNLEAQRMPFFGDDGSDHSLYARIK